MYSNVICVGDSYTNELEHYASMGITDEFDRLGYTYKSYPQLLGEHYGCKVENFGQPGMPMVFTIQTLIDKIDYILSLENPLIIYQFGFFSNLIVHIEKNNYVNWKSLASENHTGNMTDTKYGVVSAHGNDLPNVKDNMLLLDFTQRFGEQTNWAIIQTFITISDMLERMGKGNCYGIFFPRPQFELPNHRKLLGCAADMLMPEINKLFPHINDTHKSTEANQSICDYIVDKIK